MDMSMRVLRGRRAALVAATAALAVVASLLVPPTQAQAAGPLIWSTSADLNTGNLNLWFSEDEIRQGNNCILVQHAGTNGPANYWDTLFFNVVASQHNEGWVRTTPTLIVRSITFYTGPTCPNIGTEPRSSSAVRVTAVNGVRSYGIVPEWVRDTLGDGAFYALSTMLYATIIMGTAIKYPFLATAGWFEGAVGCLGGAAGNALYMFILGQNKYDSLTSALIAGCVGDATAAVAISKVAQFAAKRAETARAEQIAETLSRASSTSQSFWSAMSGLERDELR